MATRFNVVTTLVVDDSEIECQLLRAQLREFASVRLLDCVHDGLEAIAYMRRNDPLRNPQTRLYPELMLLDFKMPRCDGMQVLQFLQCQLYRPRVVLWSNTLEQVDVPWAVYLGAEIVCSKPRCLSELADILDRLGANVGHPDSVRLPDRWRDAEPIHFRECGF